MEQNTPEWLEWRKSKIGASDSPIILGISPFKTPFQLWEEKLSLKENVETPAMKYGKEKEKDAREAFCSEIGLELVPKVKMHPRYPWMIASMDGLNELAKIAVEIKCPGKEDHSIALKGEVPTHYIPQLQHQMAVCNLNDIYYYSFDGKKGISLLVQRDDEMIDLIIKKCEEFYNLVKTFTMPELTEKDIVPMNSQDWVLYTCHLKEIHKQKKELEIQEEIVKSNLLKIASGSNVRGNGVKITKYFQKGQVDYKSIPEISSMDLEPYRKPTKQIFRFTIED